MIYFDSTLLLWFFARWEMRERLATFASNLAHNVDLAKRSRSGNARNVVSNQLQEHQIKQEEEELEIRPDAIPSVWKISSQIQPRVKHQC